MKKKIIISAPSFNEDSGGIIVLHYLVHRLRKLGVDAYIYPMLALEDYPIWRNGLRRQFLLALFKNIARRILLHRRFKMCSEMDTPVASKRWLQNSVIVYPEITSGNPLKSKNVVRWLLNKPGFFNQSAVFGEDELTFFYQHDFRENCDWVDPDNMLTLSWVRDDIYFDQGLKDRRGACRLLRKGSFLSSQQSPNDDAIIIDGMTHQEKAQIFNKTKYLFCHDAHTMYLYYAALCGCIPIIIPAEGTSGDQIKATAMFKNGIAYNLDEVDFAARTRNELFSEFSDLQSAEDEMILRFVEKIKHHFDDHA